MPKILIVEDEPSIREMYAFKLKKAGFEIGLAANGSEGLKEAERFNPDLILLDLRMPVMDGQTMLRKLREEDWGKNILVIILTNVSQDEAPMELRLMRIEKYIVKAHYTPKQVLDIVTETLHRYGKLANP